MQRVAAWFLLGLLATAALSGLAGHAPARLRLLLLFPLAFGLLTGAALALLARSLELRRPFVTSLTAAFLAIGGLVNVARIAYGELAAQARREVDADPQRLLALQVLGLPEHQDVEGRRAYHLQRMALRPTFGDYLASRLTGVVGWSPAPWPEVVWGLEVLSGGAGAAWIAWRTLRHAERRFPETQVNSPEQAKT